MMKTLLKLHSLKRLTFAFKGEEGIDEFRSSGCNIFCMEISLVDF